MVRGPQVIIEFYPCDPLILNMYLVKSNISPKKMGKNHFIIENHKVKGFFGKIFLYKTMFYMLMALWSSEFHTGCIIFLF